jgi:Kef-type K+ transport system membrane component KefB
LHGETFDGNAYVASQSRVKIMLTALDAHHVAAEVFNFKSLMIVMLAAFIVPILVSRGKRIAVPIVVGELVAGIIIGPSVLGWVVVEGQAMEFLRDFGLAYLMFIAGMEIDFNMLAKIAKGNADTEDYGFLKNPMFLGTASFALTLTLSIGISFLLVARGLADSAWMFALILSTTSLGVVLPVLKERSLNETPFGQTLLLTALLADFVTMLLISIYATYIVAGGLDVRMLLVFLLFVAFAFLHRTSHFMSRIPWIKDLVEELSHATAQIKLRASLVLMVGFIVLSELLQSEMILGAFIAGVIVSLITESEDRRVEKDLEAFGFSFFIPIFFVLVGVGFDLNILLASREAMLLMPILLLAALTVKFLPALLFRAAFSWRETLAAGSLLSARLSLIIAASLIALDLNLIDDATNSAIILVAVFTVTFAPLLFAALMPEADVIEISKRERGSRALTKFLSALDTLNIEFEREDLTAMFGMFDLDNDGSIEIEEFIAVIEGDHSHEDLDVL